MALTHECPRCGRPVPTPAVEVQGEGPMAEKVRVIAANYADRTLCDDCGKRTDPVDERIDLRDHRRDRAGIPPMYELFDWDDMDRSNGRGDVIDAARRWPTVESFFFLSGKPGRGKTLLAALVALDACEHRQVKWANASVLFTRAAAEYGSDWKKDAEATLLGRGALVIDDLGAEAATPTNSNLLKAAVDGRMQFGDPIFITSNLSAPQLGARHGDWLASRLVAGSQFELPGPDWRLKLETKF